MSITKIIERFEEEVNKLKQIDVHKIQVDGDSEIYPFGMKVSRETEIFTIVDFGNIKKFIRSEIEKLLDEMPLEEKPKNKLCTHEQTWYFVDGYNQAIKELKAWRENIKK